jgi:CelD/BcsL family acetyltransferase involved in cellulose biosynthesis
MHFEWQRVDAVTPEFVAHWRALGLAASSPNIYLMPEFMLPAIRLLAPEKNPLFGALWNADRSALMALGVFDTVQPDLRFPFARLSTFRSIHSFQSGVLLRADVEAEAVDRFLDGLFGASWQMVRFTEIREDSSVHRQLLDGAERRGIRWFPDSRYHRASLEIGGGAGWQDHISQSRHKRMRRAFEKLAELGRVDFRVVKGTEISDSNIEAFLRVESLGWKRESALLATSAGAQFFREVMQDCSRKGQAFFCELLLDGTVIASTSNFCLNGHGFAFKVGNDPNYAKLSPGLLVEYAFLLASVHAGLQLREIESGSQAGSYIEAFWPDRIPMITGHLVANALPNAYASLRHRLKQAKRSISRARASA